MEDQNEQLRWVGQQHLQHGYCGRVPQQTVQVEQGEPNLTKAASAHADVQAQASNAGASSRSGTGRERVVRIGPQHTKSRTRPGGLAGPPDAMAA